MRKIVGLFCVAALGMLVAVPAGAQADTGTLALRFNGYPWSPATSEFIAEFTLPEGLQLIPGGSTSVRAWYLAASPYLLPGTFFELGSSLRWNLGQFDHPMVAFGIGTGLSLDLNGPTVSIPLIVDVEGRYRLGRAWTVNPQVSMLVFGEGFILETRIQNLWSLFGTGFALSLGGHFQYAYSGTQLMTTMGLGLDAGLAYRF